MNEAKHKSVGLRARHHDSPASVLGQPYHGRNSVTRAYHGHS